MNALEVKLKVLLVDDEPLIRRALKRAFTARGHFIGEAADGLEGLEIWRSQSWDVVLVDVQMPRCSGPEMIQTGLSEGLKSRLLAFMSADRHFSEWKTPDASTQVHFFPKPFPDVFALVNQIEALCSGIQKF